MSPSEYNYANYYAPQQAQSYQQYADPRSTPSSSLSHYQTSSNSNGMQQTSKNYQADTSYSANNYRSANWHNAPTTAVNNFPNSDSSRNDNNQYHYSQSQNSSGLEDLAYASRLNVRNDHQTYNGSTVVQNHQQPVQNNTNTSIAQLVRSPPTTSSSNSMQPRSSLQVNDSHADTPMSRAPNTAVGHQRPSSTYEQARPSSTTMNSSYDQARPSSTTANSSYEQARPSSTTNEQYQTFNGQQQWPQYSAQNNAHVSSSTSAQETELIPAQPRLPHVNSYNRDTQDRTSVSQQRPVDQPVPQTVNPNQVFSPHLDYHRIKKTTARPDTAKAIAKEKADARKSTGEGDAEAAQLPTPRLGTPQSAEAPPAKRKKPNPKAKSKAAPTSDIDAPAQAAALTLMQTANSPAVINAASVDQDSAVKLALEQQMREMFTKMREFNSKDPDMLARLWQQERDEHLAKTQAVQKVNTSQNQANAQAAASTPKALDTQPKRVTKAANKVAQKSTAIKQAKPSTGDALSTSQAAPVQSNTRVQSNAPVKINAMNTSAPRLLPPPNGTIWPSDKKVALATASRDLLLSRPNNSTKSITVEDIVKLLSTNPSYIHLCQKFEALDFEVDRTALAKGLLAAVPDINKPVNRAQQPPKSDNTIGPTTAAKSDPPISLKEFEERMLQGETLVDVSKKKNTPQQKKQKLPPPTAAAINTESRQTPALDPQLEGLDAVKKFVDSASQKSDETTVAKGQAKVSRAQKARAPTPPPTKEDMARKKTFADLVDLTQFSDEEELTEMPPIPQIVSQSQPIRLSLTPEIPTQATTTSQVDPNLSENNISKISATEPQSTIQPANESNSALDRIARSTAVIDHVQQTHQHTLQPDQPSSFSQPKFPQSIMQSIVDPHTQSNQNQNPTHNVSSAVSLVPLNHPSHSVVLAQPLDKYKAIRRSAYDPRTIARDVLLACGRHPEMRSLNAHLDSLKTIFAKSVDNNSDLSTFRWDVVDPGGPPPGSGNPIPVRIEDEQIDYADDESDGKPARKKLYQSIDAGNRDLPVPVKRPGRPRRRSDPKFRNHPETPWNTSVLNNGHLRQHPGSSSGTPSASGYIALRAAQAAGGGETPRKRGRPTGWRKWMQKSQPGSAPNSASKPMPQAPEPDHKIYKCEWHKCSAELHNLKTLRRHVSKVHGKKVEHVDLDCLWQDCGTIQTTTNNDTHSTTASLVRWKFSDKSLWQSHVETAHIEPIAWLLGDGPTGGLSDYHDSDLTDSYMSDHQGRRVTPQVIVSEAQQQAANASDFSRRSLKRTPEQEAREIQNAIEREKASIGPGVDRGGARLANAKRRHGFVDDDDTAEVIDVDD